VWAEHLRKSNPPLARSYQFTNHAERRVCIYDYGRQPANILVVPPAPSKPQDNREVDYCILWDHLRRHDLCGIVFSVRLLHVGLMHGCKSFRSLTRVSHVLTISDQQLRLRHLHSWMCTFALYTEAGFRRVPYASVSQSSH
jgi:hypothetical protein